MKSEEIRLNFLLSVQTGVIVRSIRDNRSDAETIMAMVCKIPKEVLWQAYMESLDIPEMVSEFLDYVFGNPINRITPTWLPENYQF